jgi:hypothetical protein
MVSRLIAPRLVSWVLLALSGLSSACLEAPPPSVSYDRVDNAGEVFRVFCRRLAKAAYPTDASGDRFYSECDSGAPEDEDDKSLRMLLRYRETILSSLRRLLAGEAEPTEGVQDFADGELSGFLTALVPLYDKPRESIPTATRGIATLFEQLIDPDDERAQQVLDTVARLVRRVGYRTPEQNLGAIRALLTYPKLDDLSAKLLPVISGTGVAREAWIALLNGLALELADEPIALPDRSDSTLRLVLDLALAVDPDQASGNVPPTWVLARDDQGEAVGDPSFGSPFPLVGRPDEAQERDEFGRALHDGAPVYQSFDASQTMLAALMRETARLIDRGEAPRSPLESFSHGLKPLLGPRGDRSFQIGDNDYAFQGPDIEQAPLMRFAHVLTTLARYPETSTLIRAFDQLMQEHESEATAVVYAALRINERGDAYPKAKLRGPHELWDDLVDAAVQMGRRPGLFEALIRSFTDPRSAAMGQLFAMWMRYRDEVSYPNSPSPDPNDINRAVDATFVDEVDREQPDVGMNRSIWQRTMSLIHALNGVKVCNKTGAILNVHTNIGELSFPFGDLAGTGYAECALINIQDAVEIYARSVIGQATVGIEDAFADVLAVLGKTFYISGTVGEIQETESKLTGFNTNPTPQSLARFIFAPRNKFLTDLFIPQQTVDGVAIADYEPNSLFPMEVRDDKSPLNGAASSFLDIGVPLIEAFDGKELRGVPDLKGRRLLTDGYMFGKLLSVFHEHWSARKSEPCPDAPEPGNEGCTQSLDPSAPFYSPQTGLVSYEPLLAEALDDERVGRDPTRRDVGAGRGARR